MTKERKKQPPFRDKGTFSVPPQDMEKIYDVLKKTPDVRVDRVAALKKLIAAGKYHVPSDVLAEKMIKESLMELKK
ncbi:MAG: flagellar biosynthesis anti-sigma factor FlgM [Deltaproteobacteria bacterium]|nr:flagellar biosynthesis anti-sigma factor FlgM [Deltaproteobacteria bacterium]